MIRALLLLLALSFSPLPAYPGAGHAGEISHGDVEFARTASSWDGSPEASLTGVTPGGGDQLFGHGWWYRVQGQTLETPFPTPTASLYGGNESSVDWLNVSGGAFDAHEQAFVFDAGLAGSPGDGGYVTLFLTVTNNSAVSTLQMSLFHYVDFDVEPNAPDDTASWIEWPRLFEIYDAPHTASYLAEPAPIFHRVAAHPAVVNQLNDAAHDTLTNSGTPFGPADFSAAVQWVLNIPPNAAFEAKVTLAVNTPLRCGGPLNDGIFCDGFESANRSFWLSVP